MIKNYSCEHIGFEALKSKKRDPVNTGLCVSIKRLLWKECSIEEGVERTIAMLPLTDVELRKEGR